MADLKDYAPVLPGELNDRAQDNWTPLLSIAEQLGGDWAQRGTEIAINLSAGKDEGDSVKEMLLGDLMDIFGSEDRMSTTKILEQLHEMEDRPWPEWYRGKAMSARGLARQLEGFDIGPTTIRFGTDTAKGYMREDLQDAFNRYVLPLRTPNNPSQSVTPSQTSSGTGFGDSQNVTKTPFNDHVTDTTVTPSQDVTDKKSYCQKWCMRNSSSGDLI